MMLRTGLIAALLVATTAVASHAIARSWRDHAPMVPGSLDESAGDADRSRAS
jgi:hypothetical protein